MVLIFKSHYGHRFSRFRNQNSFVDCKHIELCKYINWEGGAYINWEGGA